MNDGNGDGVAEFTGLIANPDAVRRYGKVVDSAAAQIGRIDAAVEGTALPSTAFGLLPEAGDLDAAYMQHVRTVEALFAKLPDDLTSVASGLYSTAQSYADVEYGLAAGIRQIFELPGGRVSGSAVGAVSTFANLVTDTENAYHWVSEPETSLSALAASYDQAQGGLDGLLDEAINWVISHVPELPKLLNDVTGDTDALARAATVWHDQGVTLNAVARELKTNAVGLPEEWAGQASAAFGGFMGDVVGTLGELAESMGQTQQILEGAAKESAFAHDFIVMIIREVVEWVVGNLLADALTLGLAEIAEAPATALWLADRVKEAEGAASRLAKFYKALQQTIDSLKGLKSSLKAEQGLARLKKFTTLAKDFDTAIEAGKLRNLRVFSDGKLAKLADWVWDAGKHGKNAEEVRKALDLGKGGVLGYTTVRASVAGVTAATGLSAAPGAKGLAEAMGEGALDNVKDNAQGAAEAAYLAQPPVNRIDAMINYPSIPQEP